MAAKILTNAALIFVLIQSSCEVSCEPPRGGTVNVRGPQKEMVIVERRPTSADSVCCRPKVEGGECFASAIGNLGLSGSKAFFQMVDGTQYKVVGVTVFPGCVGSGFLPCSQSVTITCEFVQGLFPIGTIRIHGPGVECRPLWPGYPREICNNTWVKVTINGTTVSSQALDGTTAAAIAMDLATKIALDPELSTIVFATVSGDTITVSAHNPGLEHTYPWHSSEAYLTTYFNEPAFQAELSPVATLLPE